MATAKAPTADDDTPAAPPPKPAGRAGGIGLLIGAVLLSVGASAGISWFFSQQALAAIKAASAEPVEGEGAEAVPEKPKAPPLYMTLEPAFVVNLDDPSGLRFLQLQIELMARDQATLDAVKQHNPRIRNALLMLLGQQQIATLAQREGKEKLQAAVLAEIQTALKAETGKGDVEAVYFTSFVMQ
ncbi:MAG TPA: flagellar basal body-associated FliL family protein [Solimonas sp.]